MFFMTAPGANGHIHIGTAFNKILGFHPQVQGERVYASRSGWDTHGLPIELHVLKTLKVNKDTVDPVFLRMHGIRPQFRRAEGEPIRLGVLGDWENPYMTLKPQYKPPSSGPS